MMDSRPGSAEAFGSRSCSRRLAESGRLRKRQVFSFTPGRLAHAPAHFFGTRQKIARGLIPARPSLAVMQIQIQSQLSLHSGPLSQVGSPAEVHRRWPFISHWKKRHNTSNRNESANFIAPTMSVSGRLTTIALPNSPGGPGGPAFDPAWAIESATTRTQR